MGKEIKSETRRSLSRKRRRKQIRRRLLVAGIIGLLLLITAGGFLLHKSRTEKAGQNDVAGTGSSGNGDRITYDTDVAGFSVDLQESRVPSRGNAKQFIALHYMGVVGEGHELDDNGTGAHFYIDWSGRIFQTADLDAIVWQVGDAGYYDVLREDVTNSNTIGIELCVKCDGNAKDEKDPAWYLTEETQEACLRLVRRLMAECDIPYENVLRHGDIVSKWCPAPYMTNNGYKTSWTWETFREKLYALDGADVPEYPIVMERP